MIVASSQELFCWGLLFLIIATGSAANDVATSRTLSFPTITNQSCTGTVPSSCSYGVTGTCDAEQLGCSCAIEFFCGWFEIAFFCTGNPVPCADIPTAASCEKNPDCTWQEETPNVVDDNLTEPHANKTTEPQPSPTTFMPVALLDDSWFMALYKASFVAEMLPGDCRLNSTLITVGCVGGQVQVTNSTTVICEELANDSVSCQTADDGLEEIIFTCEGATSDRVAGTAAIVDSGCVEDDNSTSSVRLEVFDFEASMFSQGSSSNNNSMVCLQGNNSTIDPDGEATSSLRACIGRAPVAARQEPHAASIVRIPAPTSPASAAPTQTPTLEPTNSLTYQATTNVTLQSLQPTLPPTASQMLPPSPHPTMATPVPTAPPSPFTQPAPTVSPTTLATTSPPTFEPTSSPSVEDPRNNNSTATPDLAKTPRPTSIPTSIKTSSPSIRLPTAPTRVPVSSINNRDVIQSAEQPRKFNTAMGLGLIVGCLLAAAVGTVGFFIVLSRQQGRAPPIVVVEEYPEHNGSNPFSDDDFTLEGHPSHHRPLRLP